MKHFLLLSSLLMLWACDTKITQHNDAECLQKTSECEQYSCWHPGCFCYPNPDTAKLPDQPLFEGGTAVTTVQQAEEIVRLFLASSGETEAVIVQSGEAGHGWFSVNIKGGKYLDIEHLDITPKGNVYRTGCGI